MGRGESLWLDAQARSARVTQWLGCVFLDDSVRYVILRSVAGVEDTFKELVENYRRRGDWLSFLEIRRSIDEDRGVSAINELPLEVPDEEYRALVRKTWTWSNNIWENRMGWRAIFTGKRRGLGSFTSPTDAKILESVADPLIVYRGCCSHNQAGFSWTRDRQRAERYAAAAQEWTKSQRRYVISGKISKTRILAYVTIRNEEEVVALPEDVTDQVWEDISHLEPTTEAMIKKLGKGTQ